MPSSGSLQIQGPIGNPENSHSAVGTFGTHETEGQLQDGNESAGKPSPKPPPKPQSEQPGGQEPSGRGNVPPHTPPMNV